MCLNEICNKISMCKYLSDAFPVQSDLKQDVFITTGFKLCFRICHQESSGKLGIGIEWDTSACVLCC
jgi:hypothetical protein